jgi:hypothetical protein
MQQWQIHSTLPYIKINLLKVMINIQIHDIEYAKRLYFHLFGYSNFPHISQTRGKVFNIYFSLIAIKNSNCLWECRVKSGFGKGIEKASTVWSQSKTR